MSETPEEYRAISVTVTARQRDWLYDRLRRFGIPVSWSIREALDKAFPEANREPEPTTENVA